MVIEGYVFDKIKVSEKLTQIILRKRHKEIYLHQCFIAFGFNKERIEKLDIQKKDKVRIEYYLKSKKWGDKYITSANIEKIELKERRTSQMNLDYETGEIFNN